MPGTFRCRVAAEWPGTFWASRRRANVPGTFTRSQRSQCARHFQMPSGQAHFELHDDARCRVDRHILNFTTVTRRLDGDCGSPNWNIVTIA